MANSGKDEREIRARIPALGVLRAAYEQAENELYDCMDDYLDVSDSESIKLHDIEVRSLYHKFEGQSK